MLVDQKVAELLKGLNLAEDEYPKYHKALKNYLLA
jgi:hypothetical protein